MLIVALYLFAGAIVGLLAGLLGIGGGLLVVPFLALVLPWHGLPNDLVMHTAIGTSLAIIVFTSMSSIYAHHRRGSVLWNLVRRFLPGILAGAIVGGFVAELISDHILKIIFAIFITYKAVGMVFGAALLAGSREMLIQKTFFPAAGAIGFLSTLLGLGGGAFMVPYLRNRHVPMINAIAISATCAFPIAIVGTVVYMITGWVEKVGVPYSTGYVYWPAVLGIAVTSVLCAPLGVRLAHYLPATILQHIFAVFLLVVAVNMMIN